MAWSTKLTHTEILERSDANTASIAKFEGVIAPLHLQSTEKLGALIPANIKKSLVKWYYSDEGLT